MTRILPVLALLGALGAPSLGAQMHHGASPYVDLQSREIKSLSAEEVEGLRKGDGIGFALPAELNGLPGPRHVLDLADSLALTSAQRDTVARIEAAMRTRAIALGTQLIDAERALDGLFAGGGAAEADVQAAVEESARIRGELRATHLVAHLATVRVLTPDQVRRYAHLRGYHDMAGASADPWTARPQLPPRS